MGIQAERTGTRNTKCVAELDLFRDAYAKIDHTKLIGIIAL